MADKTFGSSAGLTVLAEDQATPANGMVAHITSSWHSGYQVGDIKGAFLSDTDDTDLVGSGELVTNGTFDTASDWNLDTGWSISGGTLNYDGSDPTVFGNADQNFTTVIGKKYVAQVECLSIGGGSFNIRVDSGGTTQATFSTSGLKTVTFVANATTSNIRVQQNQNSNALSFDNISVKLADEDRSVNANGLIVNGTVTRTPVATGADLVAYSGFSASNYLEQPYNSALDFGTGDFCVMGWVKKSGTSRQVVISRYSSDHEMFLRIDATTGFLSATARAGATSIQGSASVADGVWHHAVFIRRSGVLELYRDGISDAAGVANTDNTSDADASLFLGRSGNAADTRALANGSLALWRISGTAPTAEQIAKIYEDEKFLFQENAQATLYGSSDAVTALAHDPVTDLLHAGTSAGRSVFQGLRRVENTTDAVGTAISASNNLIVEE